MESELLIIALLGQKEMIYGRCSQFLFQTDHQRKGSASKGGKAFGMQDVSEIVFTNIVDNPCIEDHFENDGGQNQFMGCEDEHRRLQ